MTFTAEEKETAHVVNIEHVQNLSTGVIGIEANEAARRAANSVGSHRGELAWGSASYNWNNHDSPLTKSSLDEVGMV